LTYRFLQKYQETIIEPSRLKTITTGHNLTSEIFSNGLHIVNVSNFLKNYKDLAINIFNFTEKLYGFPVLNLKMVTLTPLPLSARRKKNKEL
jgi:hypothetical protein